MAPDTFVHSDQPGTGHAAPALPAMDKLCIDTIRTLAMDAVQKAKSGHPGTPMAMAPVAYALWQDTLRFDPLDPTWPNRDRFVLSIGHASMLLYALLHLSGTKRIGEHGPTDQDAVSLEDIKQFRQLSSVTPGHPEYSYTSGVETTTGPLGQGVANSVGMAMAERWFATRYNKPGFPLYDYRIYAMAGDGDMMEGVSSEAASLAAHLQLSNLVWIYDSNHITIEGSTNLAFGEDVAARFAAYGWHVLHVEDANDTNAITAALREAETVTDRPTFILVHSIIGYGAPKKQGTREAHGEPLGEEEIKAAKRFYGWPEDAQFLVPEGVRENFSAQMGARSAKLRHAWMDMLARYRAQFPELAAELDMMDHHQLPEGWDKDIPTFPADAKGIASRDSSQKVLNAIGPHVPWLIGGAADLAPSTKSNMTFEGAGSFQPPALGNGTYAGRNMHFGIREHVMGSACNGMALAGLRSYGSGFLIFSDYMKPPIRLAAIMELPVIYIFTHDSIGVGEDGPTHQPVEQLIALRSIPGLITIRPGDANEVAEAWRVAMHSRHHPVAFALSRQALPTLDREKYASAAGTARGAYILADTPGAKVILIGTGSELSLCVGAYEALKAEGVPARIVSMPSWELFEQQDQAYQDEVLPDSIKGRVAVEQGSVIGWDRYTGRGGAIIGMHTFGASAPAAALATKFGFTPEKVLDAARAQAKR